MCIRDRMYEGLIEFVESSVFTLANKISQDEADGRRQAEKLTEMLLAFAEKNPGMVRVMTGDAHHAGVLLGEGEQHLGELLGLPAAVGLVLRDLVGQGEHRALDELDQPLVH